MPWSSWGRRREGTVPSLPPSLPACPKGRARPLAFSASPGNPHPPLNQLRSPRRDGRGGEQGDEEESPAARMGSSGTTARASSRCGRPVPPGSAPSPRPRLGKEPQSPAKGRWPGARPRLPFLRKPNSASLENRSVPGSPDPGRRLRNAPALLNAYNRNDDFRHPAVPWEGNSSTIPSHILRSQS